MPDIFSMKTGMIMSAIVFIGITVVGGLWSSGMSNMISVSLIYLGILYSTISVVDNNGGLVNINNNLPVVDFSWFSPIGGLGLAVVLGWILIMISQALTLQELYRLPAVQKMLKQQKKVLF